MNAQGKYISPFDDNHNHNKQNRQPLEFVQGASLTREHLFSCLERGLDPDWVIANCRSVTAEEASKQLEYTAKSDGILLDGWNEQIQFRPDVPWKSSDDDDKKEPPKYRSPKKPYDVMLPNSPDSPNYWSDFDALKERCFKVNDVPCLVVTEGMFKAIAGCSNGIPTIALLGVEMGLTQAKNDPDKERILLIWMKIFAHSGFGFIIAFDADIADNKKV